MKERILILMCLGLLTAFSVFPLIRAHMTRPRSVLSAPAPDTNTNVMPGLRRDNVSAAAIVIPYVTRS